MMTQPTERAFQSVQQEGITTLAVDGTFVKRGYIASQGEPMLRRLSAWYDARKRDDPLAVKSTQSRYVNVTLRSHREFDFHFFEFIE